MKTIYNSLLFIIMLWPAIISSQTRTVTGTIKDPLTGEPLPGVNIVIKGTTIGVITDINGNYKIEAPIGSTLVVTFVGYKAQELIVGPEEGDTKKTERKIFKHRIPDNPEKTIAPYFFVQSDNPEVDRMPLKSTSADVNISGVIAEVTIKQVYVNEGQNTLEAIYIFPGSTRAAVYAMNMTIGDRKLYAKIKEKQQARVEYEQAKQEGKTASLLEQQRPNVFQMNVANILPGDSITVEMKYTELLEYNGGIYEFVYPTVVGPRYSNYEDNEQNKSEQWVSNPYLKEKELPNYSFQLKTVLNAGMSIKDIYSSSHKVNIIYSSQNSAEILLDPSESQGGNRDFVLRYRLSGNKVESGILLYKHNDENFFTLMMQPPKVTTPELIPPREYVFIVDVSGSMSGFPLDVSKEMIKNILSHMRSIDKFNIILFAGGSSTYSEESVEANEDNIKDAIRYIDRQQGGGGTEILPAFERAFNLPYDEGYARMFVALTDGYVSIEKELFNYISEHLNEANCFAVGIGSAPNRYLIEGIAAAGMGQPYIVQDEKEAKTTGKKFMDFVENPVFTHINLSYSKFDVYDVQPENVPDVFSERPVIVTGKFKGEAKGSITVSGYAGSRLYSQTFKVDSANSDNNPALRYLWARTKIKYLDDYAKFYSGSNNYFQDTEEEKNSTKKEVTTLGLKYNLLTQYTSFIAVDSIVRNKSKEIVTVKQPLPLPQGVSNLAVGGDLTLSQDLQQLSEVVVIGYGVQKKSNVTGSVSYISTENISQTPVNVLEALQGRVSGVNIISSSGNPGGSQEIRIRCIASPNSTNPLFIVDGQVVTDLNSINSSDINSIDVVKDASASAIYGAAASNGVILVTTKEGNPGRLKININSSFMVDKTGKLPEMQNKYGQSNDSTGFSWGPAVTGSFDPYSIFTNGKTADVFVSISKGGEKNKFYLSAGNTAQKGILPNSGSNKSTFSANGKKQLWKAMELSVSGLVTQLNDNRMSRSSNLAGIMHGIVTNPPSFDLGNGLTGKDAANNNSSYILSDGNQRARINSNNPYWLLNKGKADDKTTSLIAKAGIKYTHKSIGIQYNFGVNALKNDKLVALDKGTYATNNGQFTRREDLLYNNSHNLTLTFNKTFADFEVSAILNNDYTNSRRDISRKYGTSLNAPGIYNLQNSIIRDSLEIKLEQNKNNLSGSLTVNFKDILIAQASLGNEWLKIQSDIAKSFNYYGGSLVFKFANLQMFRYNGLFNSGKLYTNIGLNYKDAPYFTNNTFYTSGFMTGNELSYYEKSELVYSSVLPEKNNFFNVGIELGFINDRLIVSIDRYFKNTKDIIFPALLSNMDEPIREFGLINQGKSSTKGTEFSAELKTFKGNFRVVNKVIFSQYANIYNGSFIAYTGTNTGNARIAAIDGKPFGVIYGSHFQRNIDGKLTINENGFPVKSLTDSIIGDTNPDFVLNFNNTISFKNWELSFMLEWKKGGDIWNGTRKAMNYAGTSKESGDIRTQTNFIFNGVREDGSVNNITVDLSTNENQQRWRDYSVTDANLIEDGSWIKFRQVSLGYNLPKQLIRRIKLTKCTISLIGNNLFTITRYSGIDPETSFTGADNGIGLDLFNFPKTRSYGISLNLQF